MYYMYISDDGALVYNCRMLAKIEGIEELQGLKYLRLTGSFPLVVGQGEDWH